MSPSEYDSLINSLKKLPGEVKSLIEKRIELFTIEMGERVSGIIAHAFYRVTGVILLAVGSILLLFAVANFVGEYLGSEGLGFIVVSAPILLVGFLFFLRRPRSMVIRTRDKMLQQFMRDLTEQISQFDIGGEANPEKETSAGEGEKGREKSEKTADQEPEKSN